MRSLKSSLSLAVVVVALAVLTGCGSEGSHGGDSHDGHSHSGGGSTTGEPRVIEDTGPRLTVKAAEDPSGGYRVKLNTRHFKILNTGQQAEPSGDTVAGHAHLYVDRNMVAMFYDSQYRLPLMNPGRHVISVMLSDMNHRPFLVNGQIIRDTAVVTVPDRADTGP